MLFSTDVSIIVIYQEIFCVKLASKCLFFFLWRGRYNLAQGGRHSGKYAFCFKHWLFPSYLSSSSATLIYQDRDLCIGNHIYESHIHTYIDTHIETRIISRAEAINQSILDFNGSATSIRSIHHQCAWGFREGNNNSTQKSRCSSVLEEQIPVIACMINRVTIEVHLGLYQNTRNT